MGFAELLQARDDERTRVEASNRIVEAAERLFVAIDRLLMAIGESEGDVAVSLAKSVEAEK